MRILGIDPGTLSCGYAVIEADGNDKQLLVSGILKNKTYSTIPYRVRSSFDFFNALISAWKIDIISIETPFYGINAQTFLKLGYIRGIIYLLSEQLECKIMEFAPSRVKQIVAGRGDATKEDVARAVYKMFPLMETGQKLDITDAIAVALSALE